MRFQDFKRDFRISTDFKCGFRISNWVVDTAKLAIDVRVAGRANHAPQLIEGVAYEWRLRSRDYVVYRNNATIYGACDRIEDFKSKISR